MNEPCKALLYCSVGFLFFSLIIPMEWIGESNDYWFHLARAKGMQNCSDQGFTDWTCTNYPPAFHWLAGPFAFSETAFKLFILFLFAFLTPLLLFFSCKKALVVPAYFATSYFYTIQAQLYAQGLTMLLLILMFMPLPWKKGKWIVRGALVVIAPYVHSNAFPLLAFSFVVLLVEDLIKGKAWKKLGFLQCSPFWGQTPAWSNTQVSPVAYAPQALTINSILSFFVKGCPVPFLFFGLKKMWMEKAMPVLIVVLLCGIMAEINNNRILLCIPLLVLPYAIREPFFEKKRGLLLILALMAFQLEQFIAFNIWCG